MPSPRDFLSQEAMNEVVVRVGTERVQTDQDALPASTGDEHGVSRRGLRERRFGFELQLALGWLRLSRFRSSSRKFKFNFPLMQDF